MRNNFLAILLISIAAIAVSLRLLPPGFHLIHDDQQIARLFLFDQALREGQFPVRWVDGLGFGFGYPLFVFYPPLVYMLGELIHLLGFDFINSIKTVFFISILASGFSMYFLVKELWGRLPATVASFFYILVPYRAIDIYIRGALAESFSFVWLPLILLSFYKLAKTQQSKYIYLSAIFLALLMLTHNLIFLPFMLILPIYLLFLFSISKNKRLITFHFALSTLLAAGLSAFFWIPALLEKKFTIVDELLLVSLADYRSHFVFLTQLWNWPWGFGGSAAGLADGLSFKIGKLHILVSIAAFIVTLIHILKNKASRQLLALRLGLRSHVGEGGSFSVGGSIVFFLLFILSAFMTTFHSKLVWDLIPPLGYLQFPWRFLTFTALFTSVLAGSLVYLLRLPILRLIVSVILIILLFIPNLKLFKPQQYRQSLTDEIATSRETISWYVAGSSFEYLPKAVELYTGNLGTNLVKIDKEDIPQAKIEITNGLAQINYLIDKPHVVEFEANVQKEIRIKANIFNFPGWQAKVDNQTVQIDDNNRLKLITFAVPQGIHSIQIEFKNTITRTVSNFISLLSVLTVIFLVLVKRGSNKLPRTKSHRSYSLSLQEQQKTPMFYLSTTRKYVIANLAFIPTLRKWGFLLSDYKWPTKNQL